MDKKTEDYMIIGKSFGLLFFAVILMVMFTLLLLRINNFVSDKENMAELNLMNTEHIQGEVVEKKDKSYIKKDGSVLFIGGGEKKVEDYEVKIKFGKEQYKTIKAKENEYLDINKSDKLNVVIDSNDNSIKYNLDDKYDREIYESYKKELK